MDGSLPHPIARLAWHRRQISKLFSLPWMTVPPIPMRDSLWIENQYFILHPRPIIGLLYPPLEHGISQDPLEILVKPVV